MEKSINDFEKEVKELSDTELDKVAGGGYAAYSCLSGFRYCIMLNMCLTKEQWAGYFGQEDADEAFKDYVDVKALG